MSNPTNSQPPSQELHERAIVASMIGFQLAQYDWPSNLATLFRHAPESFDDLRYGQIAAAVWELSTQKKPVHVLTVRNILERDGQTTAVDILPILEVDALPMDIAEYQAKPVLESFQRRQFAKTIDEAQRSLQSQPGQAALIARTTNATLQDLYSSPGASNKIAAVRFNVQTPPPPEAVLFTLGREVSIATKGNVSAIVSQAKGGKSAFVSAMPAAAISPCPDKCDLLGVRAMNPAGLPVLLLDTEHSAFHHHALCERILRRAMLTESEKLHAYRFAGFSVPDLNAALEQLIRERKWHSIILDGTADFVADVNDAEECNAFVARLHGLAIKHDTHIVNVLHLNPSSDFKSRGHLGSQLERKAETNLRIEKVDEISVVFADKNRGAAIPKSTGPRFAWSTEKRMHVSIQTLAVGKAEAKAQELREQAAEAFRLAGKPALHWKELVEALRQVPGIKSERTAARVVADLKSHNFISKNIISQWEQRP